MKQKRCRSMSKIALALTLSAVLLGCSSSKDVYHVRSERWVADSIEVQLFATAAPDAPTVSLPSISIFCQSCNLIDPPRDLTFDPAGTARVFMPETIQQLEPRLHLLGKGIDTTIILHALPPAEDAARYHLTQPLVGRVMLLQEAPLYATATQDSVVTSAMTGDQMNIFGDDTYFFPVHHPMFSTPLYLLKTNAVRLF